MSLIYGYEEKGATGSGEQVEQVKNNKEEYRRYKRIYRGCKQS